MIDGAEYMQWSANNNMEGVTCYTFIGKVLLEAFGIRTPALKHPRSIRAQEKEASLQRDFNGDWREVADPKCGDVILLVLGGTRPHIGIMVDANSFLHFSESDKMVKRDSREALQWRNRVEGFYRHISC